MDEEDKKIIKNNIDKITHQLLLPGELWDFLINNKELQDSGLESGLDKAKSQVNFIKEQIKSFKEYEKIFLYIIYINLNLRTDDLEAIYEKCLPIEINKKDYFSDCENKFKDDFIKTKRVQNHLTSEITETIDFTHPNYYEAVEKVINEEVSESKVFESIILKLYDLRNDIRYVLLKFNIFKNLCKFYINIGRTRDLVFEILSDINSENIEEKKLVQSKGLCNLSLYDNSLPYYIEFLNNYKEFKDESITNYLEQIVGAKAEDPHLKFVIAFTMAFNMDSKQIKEIKFLLNKFERDDDGFIELSITTIIIKHNKVLDEKEFTLLKEYNNKDQQITLLIKNYDEINDYLKDLLIGYVSNSEVEMPIDSIPFVLLKYNYLPPQIHNRYDFIFTSFNEKIKPHIKEAFELWIQQYVNSIDNEEEGWQNLNKKVVELFLSWLKDGNYSKDLYGPKGFYKWIFYSLNHEKNTCFVDIDNNIYIKDIGPSTSKGEQNFEELLTFKEKIAPRLREPIPQDLIVTILKNIFKLLINLKSPFEKAEVMWCAFLLADEDKPEIGEAIIKAIEKDNAVIKAFFDCKHFYEYPFKLSDFQEELIDRMMQYSNEEIESAYDGFCDQRNRSDVNLDDYL